MKDVDMTALRKMGADRNTERKASAACDSWLTAQAEFRALEAWQCAKINYYRAEADAEAEYDLSMRLAREQRDAARAEWHTSSHPQAVVDRREADGTAAAEREAARAAKLQAAERLARSGAR